MLGMENSPLAIKGERHTENRDECQAQGADNYKDTVVDIERACPREAISNICRAS